MHVQPMINIRHGNVILCIIVVHMNDLANVVGLVQLLARYLFVYHFYASKEMLI